MKAGRLFLLTGLAMGWVVLEIFPACSTPQPKYSPENWGVGIAFQHATLNGQPIDVLLDTGTGFSNMPPGNAKRLGVTSAYSSDKMDAQVAQMALWLSKPVELKIGEQTFSVQLPVMGPELSPPDKEWFFDCLIGWPQVQGNDYLFFDSNTHILRALDKLPPDISTWLRLKIHPNRVLAVDVPLPDGQTGTLAIDTGTGVVGLPVKQYQEWKSAHQSAQNWPLTHDMLGDDQSKSEMAMADKVTIGPLALNNVMIGSVSGWEEYFVDGKFAGRLSRPALDRLDLILDNKDGDAYFRTKTPFGAPPAANPNGAANAANPPNPPRGWYVADNVRIGLDGILLSQAEFKIFAQDFVGAKADLDRARLLNPQNPHAYFSQALFALYSGDWASAEAAFTQAVTIGIGGLQNGQIVNCYFNRAVARQILGNFAGAWDDFAEATKVRPLDAKDELPFMEILRRRLNRPADDFAQVVAGWADDWTKSKGQFLAGSLNEPDFLAQAAKGDPGKIREQQSQVYYFVGMMRLLDGDKPGAKKFFQKCLDVDIKYSTEYLLARAELSRLNGPAPK